MSVIEEKQKSTLDGGLLVIKASAGSGKTYTLAQLYIELLLLRPGRHGRLELRQNPGYHQHILAITFTNKATDEMKRRIVSELYQLATDARRSPYYTHFQALCTPQALAGLQQAARQALTALLMNYSQMKVSTIDSFFQSILRNFARELDRDYNYEVQIDEEFAVRSALHDFLTSLGRDSQRRDGNRHDARIIEDWVREYIQGNVEQAENWNFFYNAQLADFAKNINTELFRSRLSEIRDYLSRPDGQGQRQSDLSRIRAFKQQLVKIRNHYKTRYTNDFNDVLPAIMQRCNIEEIHLSGNKPLCTFVLRARMATGVAPTDALRGVNAANLAQQFKGKFVPTEQAQAEILTMIDNLLTAYDTWKLFAAMVNNVGLLGLIGEIDLSLEQYRKDNNVVLIADTNELIYRIVTSQRDAVPFIYERVGTWINHFMIDEFQDTSHKQYENFVPLLDESLAQGTDNFNLIIGDAKQSIYRFRNADPSLFRDQLNSDFAQKGLRLNTLPTNFRSLQAVVQFNNRWIEQLLRHYGCGDSQTIAADLVMRTYEPTQRESDYQQLISKLPPAHPQGCVRVLTQSPDGKPYTNELALAELPDYLLELHQRLRWAQIGILVNTNKEATAVVQTILDHNKHCAEQPASRIAVTSEEAMQLQNSPVVRRVVSLLRFVDMVQYQVQDDAAEDTGGETAAPDTGASRKLSEQRLCQVLGEFVAAMARQGESDAAATGSILDQCFAAHDQATTGSASKKMQHYANELTHLLPDPRTHLLTLTSIVERIIERIIGGDSTHEGETAFLLAFQSCVVDFASRTSGGTVREFLRFWDQKREKLTVASASGEDAVTMMTIHKAKGLEFDCVVIPFAGWEMNDNSKETLYWLPRECWLSQQGNSLLAGVPGVEPNDELLPPLIPIKKAFARELARRQGILTHFLDSQRADTLIDNLNKTYVAFTRPRMELHMFAPTSSKTKSDAVERVGDLLAAMVPTIEGVESWVCPLAMPARPHPSPSARLPPCRNTTSRPRPAR